MGASTKRLRQTLWVAVAAAMLVPSKARARSRGVASVTGADPVQRQGRRRAERRTPQSMPRVPSPCGRHVAEVADGVVFVDGRRIHPAAGSVFLMSQPTWRPDGRALAWLERRQGQTQLVVVPALDAGTDPLPWALPVVSGDDRVFWAGPRRVVVGPAPLAPRAVATWSE